MANSVKRSEKGKKGYLRYKQENRRIKNKIRKLKRLAKKHPNDKTNPFAEAYTGKRPDWMASGV